MYQRRNAATIVVATFVGLLTTGCGGNSGAASPSGSCTASTGSDYWGVSAGEVQLADGLKVTTVQALAATSNSAHYDVIVRVCGNSAATGSTLIAAATSLAGHFQSGVMGAQLDSLRVTNVDVPTGDGRIRCDDFTSGACTSADGWKTADQS